MEDLYESKWVGFIVGAILLLAMLPDVSFAETRFHAFHPTMQYEPVKFKPECTYIARASVSIASEYGFTDQRDLALSSNTVMVVPQHVQNDEYGPWGYLEVGITLELAQKLIAAGMFNGTVWSESGANGLSLGEALAMGHTVYSPRLIVSQTRYGSHTDSGDIRTDTQLAFDFFNPGRMAIETHVQSTSEQDPWSNTPPNSFLHGVVETCPDAAVLEVYSITATSEYSSSYGAEKLVDKNTSSIWYSQQGVERVEIDLSLAEIATVSELTIGWNYYSCDSVELQASEPYNGVGEYVTIAMGYEGAMHPENNNITLKVPRDATHYIPPTHSYRVVFNGCNGYFASASELTLKGFVGGAFY